jgi:hypothetical protein
MASGMVLGMVLVMGFRTMDEGARGADRREDARAHPMPARAAQWVLCTACEVVGDVCQPDLARPGRLVSVCPRCGAWRIYSGPQLVAKLFEGAGRTVAAGAGRRS